MSADRYIDNGDNTVTDERTGLMWEQAGSDTRYNYNAAMARCCDLTLAGHTDWRLPTIQELFSIVDFERRRPAIDPVFTTVADFYWSATTYATNPFDAWGVDFSNGLVYDDFFVEGGNFYVRAVRAGSLTLRSFDTLKAENAQLRAHLAQHATLLVRWYRDFGECLHKTAEGADDCPAMLGEPNECSCGLSALLADLPEAPKGES